jgi:hypothetical protein
MPNDEKEAAALATLVIGAWTLIGHWDFVIGHFPLKALWKS